MKKVVDVTMHVTCLEDDAPDLRKLMRELFNNPDVALVTRPGKGGISTSKPRKIAKWMMEVLSPEDC